MEPIWKVKSRISPQSLDGEKSMKTTDKYEVEGCFNLKTSRHNIMCTFFQICMIMVEI